MHPRLESSPVRTGPHGCGTCFFICVPWGEFVFMKEAPPRRSVLRPSTSAKIPHIFSRLEHSGESDLSILGHFPIDRFEISLYPANA